MREFQNLIKNISSIKTPCYVALEDRLEANLKLLNSIEKSTNSKILIALKGVAFFHCAPLISHYLSGATASGLNEALLGYEELFSSTAISRNSTLFSKQIYSFKDEYKFNFYKDILDDDLYPTTIANGKEIAVFSPAYKDNEIEQLCKISTHIIFNSFNQFYKFQDKILKANLRREEINQPKIEIGLRINPMYSEVKEAIYNPCAPKSRLGITPKEFKNHMQGKNLKDLGISGLHFHTLCEQDSYALESTLERAVLHFEPYFSAVKWLNFGGGHHITRDDYDVAHLINLINNFKQKYNLEIMLEPGEAVGLNAGVLVASVIDIVENDGKIAILDVSVSAHMPDCLEMPYRPQVFKINEDGSIDKDRGENMEFAYRLAGPTCLSGDVIGDYSFAAPLNIGDKLVFTDMLHYTIVKNTTFNGVPLPSLGVVSDRGFSLVKDFDYLAYKDRN